jgi:NMD protein affecting ribosome stability and mRNA decay
MCHACFSAAHSPAEFPQAVQAICCRHCSAREVPGGWELHDSPADAAGAALRGALAWADGLTGNQLDFELRELDPHRFRADGSASGSLDGVALEQRFECDILLEFRACTSCSRQAGGYYEATLQLRTPREAVLKAAVARVNAALEEGAPQFFATEDGPVRGGYDFQLSSTDRARALSRALLLAMGGEVKETSSLVGRREGRDVLRHTFGVRLPPVLADDVVLHDGTAWRGAPHPRPPPPAPLRVGIAPGLEAEALRAGGGAAAGRGARSAGGEPARPRTAAARPVHAAHGRGARARGVGRQRGCGARRR